jgi:hypothetical protein
MNFNTLKTKTALIFLAKQHKKLRATNDNIPDKVESVGVLADSRLFGSYDISRNLSQKLKMPHNKFEIIIFENLKDDFVTRHYNTFSEKDFGMYARIKAQNVIGFVNTKFDLLINYCNSDSIFPSIIAYRSNSRFKVGFADDKMEKLYDLMISIEGNKIDVFNDELTKYLQIMTLI